MDDTVLQFIKDDLAESKKDVRSGFKATNGRLLSLEKWRWTITGAITILTGLFGLFGWKMLL